MRIYKFISIAILCIGLCLAGCQELGDIKNQLNELENRLNALEALCKQTNQDLLSLTAIVQALEANDKITDIRPIEEGGKVVGYIITFSQKGEVKIMNGKDAEAPKISIKQDADGKWYWTFNGQWLLDENGQRVVATGADGITPKLKIVDGYWYVSYDNGKTWETEPLGLVEGQPANPVFKNITYDSNFVYITLNDGVTTLKIPRVDANGPLATLVVESATINSVTFKGHVNASASDLVFGLVTLYYSEMADFNIHTANSVKVTTFDAAQNFTIVLDNLKAGTTYYYCLTAKVKGAEYYSDVASVSTSASGWSAGTYFAAGVTEHSGWYDVNKRKDNEGGWNGSFLHCWAITASNMIQWWQDNYKAGGNVLPAGTPDGPGTLFELDIYEKMKDCFTDASGSTQVAIHWYFTGQDREANMQGGNHPKPNTGGFFKSSIGPLLQAMGGDSYLVNTNGYDAWGSGKTDPRSAMVIVSEYLREALKNGIAGLTIRAGRSLLHEVTLWGVDLDANGNLTHVWITDSDDQMSLHYSEPRTTVLHHLKVEDKGNAVAIQGYYNGDKPEIVAITTLKAYPSK